MAEDPLVTAAEVARLAGVGRAAVSNWRRRYADFPCAAEGTAAGPRFRLSQIQRWLDEQGRSAPPSAMEQLWRALRADDETGEMAALARLARQLRAPSARLAPEPVRAALARLADTPRAELLDAVCEQFFTVQQRAHLTTPPQLAALMTELAAPFQTVFDPACGPGSLLLAAAGRGAGSVEGQEIDTGLAELAQARLGLHTHARVRPGDSLRADAFPGLRADAVLCHPPFAQRDWGHAELGIDRRWEYGFPPKGEPELAWLQHCLAHARPGGTVVLLLTAGVAARRAGRSIRQALLRRGVLRAVIGLPGGVLMTTGVPLHLWVLRAPPVEPNEPVLLLDAGEHRPARRGQVDWAALRQAVLGPWREFTETPAVPEVAGRVRSVAPIELLDEEVDLTPARHLPLPRPEFDVAATTKLRDRLAELLVTLGASLPRIEPAQRADASSTTVGELARAGALRLHQPST
ncbi:MAG: N-6 DNA methylase, partial [Sciscionella sp.]